MSTLFTDLAPLVPLLATVAAVVVVLASAHWFLKRRWQDQPHAQFHFQLIMLAMSFAGGLAIVVALPVNDALRGQLLSLIGILLSAAIALSSTTFIGNAMAGIMLKALKSARPGDFITVAELTGRITEMDLLHTEIQTEFRDLVTVPNLYLVTQPLRVVRASGTIIQAQVSLGYDVPHPRVSELLREAAAAAGLEDGFVQVRALGDFSVTYQVAGLLRDVTSLISARSRLRICVLDALHSAGIEIVSPNFMNTRALDPQTAVIPAATPTSESELENRAEEIAFDKAEEAASIEKIRAAIEAVDKELSALEDTEQDDAARDGQRERLEARKARLARLLEAADEAVQED